MPAPRGRVTGAYNPAMALGWFTGSKEASVSELVAAKKYKKALELLRQQFKDGSRDPRLRLQLADVLVLSGRAREAVPILSALADEYAREGFAAKAIAVLKKLQKVAPGKPDVEKRLAELLHKRIGSAPAAAPPRPSAVPVEFGMEEAGGEMGEIAIGETIAPVSAPSAPTAPHGNAAVAASAPPPAPAAAPPPTAAPAPARSVPASAATAAKAQAAPAAAAPPPADDEFFGLLDDIVDSDASVDEDGPSPGAAAEAPAQSPLLAAFSEGELQAVIARFELLSFAPGDVVVSEGQPGDSLFVLTTGSLKAFVRDQSGRNVPVRELKEGSLFGEVSILTGKPRSATITCASPCELLELDRAALDEIVTQYPRVRDVIREAYESRAGSLEEMLAREGWEGPSPTKPGPTPAR